MTYTHLITRRSDGCSWRVSMQPTSALGTEKEQEFIRKNLPPKYFAVAPIKDVRARR